MSMGMWQEIQKADEYLRRYLKSIDCVRQGRTVKLTVTYIFDTTEQAKEYVSRVKLVKAQMSSQT